MTLVPKIPQAGAAAPLEIPRNFVERIPYEKGFGVYYSEKVRPILKNLEQVRLAKLQELNKRKPIAYVVFALGYGLAIWLTVSVEAPLPGFWLFLVGMFTTIIGGVILRGPKDAFKDEIKQKLLPPVAKFFGELDYSDQESPDWELLNRSGLFPPNNGSKTDDFITGKRSGTEFTFAEIALTHTSTHRSRDSGGHSRSRKSTYGVFSGIIFLVNYDAPFKGRTFIKRVKRENAPMMRWETCGANGLNRVEMSDPEFSGEFEVYSSEEKEAQSLITPHLKQGLIKVAAQYGKSAVWCSFFDGNKLLLAIPHDGVIKETGKSFFEAGSLKSSLSDLVLLREYLAQFKTILDTVDAVSPSNTATL